MAHDFGICVGKVWDDSKPHAYFFGYANGLMYRAFDCRAFGHGIAIDAAAARLGLSWAIMVFDGMNYPDSTRMDCIKEFYHRIKHGDLRNEPWFYIDYS